MTGVASTTLPLTVLRRGKVRDVYEVDADRLLVVATDRVSAFDVVMGETVPHKGAVLTQLTAWWLRQIEGAVSHHMISADIDEIARAVPTLDAHRDLLRGRAMLVWRAGRSFAEVSDRVAGFPILPQPVVPPTRAMPVDAASDDGPSE